MAIKVFHPDGAPARGRVASRNLSRGGIGLIHGGFVHAGSRCVVGLGLLGMGRMESPGEVVTCRHVVGPIHELGVRFEEAIDDATMVRLMRPASGPAEPKPEANIAETARVIYLDSSAAARHRARRALASGPVELTVTPALPESVRVAAKGAADLFVVASVLDGGSAACAISAVREAGHRGATAVVGRVENPIIEAGLVRLGVRAIGPRPLDRQGWLDLIRRCLRPGEAADGAFSERAVRAHRIAMLERIGALSMGSGSL